LPDMNECENYIMAGEMCLDAAKKICINAEFIFLAILIGNLL